ncbi:MAG: CHAD domain-containing protein [Candidatus Dormibacteraeota bacterium]|nr:CHAD domain-containing protein [Candidatus Dormibacteraeota bacterium]
MSAADASRWTLVAGPQFRTPELDSVDGIVAGAPELTLLRTIYVDTIDLRILRSGGELRLEHGRGWTVVLGSGENAAQHVARVHHFDGTQGVPPAALDLLTGYTRGAPVRPVLHTRTERRDVVLTDGDEQELGTLRDDLVTVMHGRRIATRFRELEVVASGDGNGEQARLASVVAALRAAGAAPASSAPTATRAMGAPAAAAPDVTVPPPSREPSAAEAVRRAIALAVTRLILNDAAVRVGTDPEGVHQARVATRRLRSDLRTFRPLLDAEWVARLREELSVVAGLLGAVRDTDVLLQRMNAAAATLRDGEATAAMGVVSGLEEARAAARTALLEVMRGERYRRLLDDLVGAASMPRTTPEASGNAAAILPSLARGPWRKLRKRVAQLPADPPDADLHEVRIFAKRARYAAEAVASVSRPGVGEFASAVAKLQEVLGDHHDAVVAEAWLRERESLIEDRFVLGELVGLERAAAAASRQAWPAAWAAARKAHPHQWS